MKFLSDPGRIRKSIVQSLEKTESLDVAVAFVGRDWADIIGTFKGPIRLVCWLSSPNTNPYAVEQMMKRENIYVRHLPAMHAKVFVLKGDSSKCVVGSANLTRAALSEENASGQYEAAVDISERRSVRNAERWFQRLWKDARAISQHDLSSAKKIWNRAQSRKAGSARNGGAERSLGGASSLLSANWVPPDVLVELAKKVRSTDFSNFDKYQSVLSMIARHGQRTDVEKLIDFVAEWTGRKGTFQSALDEPTDRIRRAFRILFDHSRSVDNRLRKLDTGGPDKISGFGLPSLTMILYWRIPTEYPPFNRPTKRFLKDFDFDQIVPKTLSPRQYGNWIAFAQDLSARLDLPSSGHIDRLVREYTRDLDIE